MSYPPDRTISELESAGSLSSLPPVSTHAEQQEVFMPVVQEQLDVRKAVRTTGAVRIQKIVHESEELVSEALASETVDVERISMDLIVDTPPPIRTEGDVTIIPVLREVLVLTKQLHLVEELRVTRRRSVVDHQQSVTLLAEEILVERQPALD